MSCMLLLWLLHAGVLTIGKSDMFWILSSVLLHTGVSGIGTGGNHGEYCIVSTVCRSIKSSFTDLHLTNLHLLFIYIFDIAVFFPHFKLIKTMEYFIVKIIQFIRC